MVNLIKIICSNNLCYKEAGIPIFIDNEKVTGIRPVTFSNDLNSYFKNIRISLAFNKVYG